MGDEKLTTIIKQNLHKKIKKTLQFFSRIAPLLQIPIKVIKLIFILLAFAIGTSTAYADVYKCVVNGKTVYSDSRCAYKPDTIKIDPNQNVVQGERSSVNNGAQPNATARSNDPKCAELSDRLSHARTIGDLDKYSKEYEFRCVAAKSNNPKCAELLDQLSYVRSQGDLNRISQAYELQCMSPGDREVSAQKRNNQEMQRKLNDIQRTQQEIQLRQRGIGY